MEINRDTTFAAELNLPPQLAKQFDMIEVKEHILEKRLDEVASNLAKKAGYDLVPWF